MSLPKTYLQMLSTLTPEGTLQMQLADTPMPTPGPDDVLVRVEAAPINPSDQGVMFGWSSMDQATTTGSGAEIALQAPVAAQGMRMMKARVGQDLTLGNEGSGTVVAAGENAQALMGKRVGVMGGGMYAQYKLVKEMMCLPLGPDHSAKDGAACFVNPLTALSMVETMRLEGHSALVHTAAASNLGQMLNRICQADGVQLVNIVRSAAQEQLLRDMGATHVVDSSKDSFMTDLTNAVHETGATLAFDATGGGRLASDILTAMEAAAARTPGAYSIYGSVKHKQVYLYGGLQQSETVLTRGYGMAWGVGGWLLPNFLARVGHEVGAKMRGRVVKELTTTFANKYSDEISLSDALKADIVARYYAKKTGEKFLINPQLPI
ncbi:MAG: zinc-binding dehydrogenase [Sulfitobacter sp.]|nr:zinc-binding dehydrogenase [Sulfitobacter sp.]